MAYGTGRNIALLKWEINEADFLWNWNYFSSLIQIYINLFSSVLSHSIPVYCTSIHSCYSLDISLISIIQKTRIWKYGKIINLIINH